MHIKRLRKLDAQMAKERRRLGKKTRKGSK